MTALHVYILACDHPGCGRTHEFGLTTAAEARRFAHHDGWRHRIFQAAARMGPARSCDFCPDHGADADAAAPPPRQPPPPEPDPVFNDPAFDE